MTFTITIALLAWAASVTTLNESYEVNGRQFEDCQAALQYAQSLDSRAIARCNSSYEVIPHHFEESAVNAPTNDAEAAVPIRRRLRDYVLVDEIELTNPDASGVTFLSDDSVLITYQTSLEFRRIDGEILKTISGIDGDIEGLEYHGDMLYAVAERGSTHIELSLTGLEIVPISEFVLPGRGIECIAHDPDTGRFFYGQEYSGNLIDDQNNIVFSFTRDLSACAVHDGDIMAITSHPSRRSVWHRIDVTSQQIVDSMPLLDGDWEGISCRRDRCALVREAFGQSSAIMSVFEARKK